MIGYYGMVTGRGARWSSIHLVLNGSPLCGYKPHKDMEFYYVSYHYEHITCKRCIRKNSSRLSRLHRQSDQRRTTADRKR